MTAGGGGGILIASTLYLGGGSRKRGDPFPPIGFDKFDLVLEQIEELGLNLSRS